MSNDYATHYRQLAKDAQRRANDTLSCAESQIYRNLALIYTQKSIEADDIARRMREVRELKAIENKRLRSLLDCL